jgi:serine phosphatase RsbU (regulator of sigma subunit)
MAAQDVALGETSSTKRPEQTRVLLIEDDDGDAFLVEELLLEVGAGVEVVRARSLAEAKDLLPGPACVLLDLGLPDTHELDGLRWLQENVPQVAVVVLTGLADEYLGEEAVRTGAQDYLVKGQVDGQLLDRVIRYAVERVRSEEVQRQLREAQIYAEENSRLERGLLPTPLLSDPAVSMVARYSPGGQRLLLGGDFYDVVEAADGWVHAVMGDVCGHGPDEAALGVSMRVAWRAMVLAARPVSEVLTTLDQLFAHERHRTPLFTTLCMLSVDPSRTSARLYLAGHPPPLLITPDGVRQLQAPVRTPIGVGDGTTWPSAEIELGEKWSVVLYTDGLIEGRTGQGNDRLDVDGLIGLVEEVLPTVTWPAPATAGSEGSAGPKPDEGLLDELLDRARALNGGDLDDDVAVLALARTGTDTDDGGTA